MLTPEQKYRIAVLEREVMHLAGSVAMRFLRTDTRTCDCPYCVPMRALAHTLGKLAKEMIDAGLGDQRVGASDGGDDPQPAQPPLPPPTGNMFGSLFRGLRKPPTGAN